MMGFDGPTLLGMWAGTALVTFLYGWEHYKLDVFLHHGMQARFSDYLKVCWAFVERLVG